MRIFILGLLLLVNFIFQTTWLPLLSIQGVVPHTGVILVVSYALLRGKYEGAFAGFFMGLLEDIFFGNGFGYYSLLGLITGYLAGRSHENFYRENYLFPVMLCSISMFAYESMIFVTGFLPRGQWNYVYFLVRFILPEVLYTAVITIFLYRFLYAINEWLELRLKYASRL